MRPSILGLHHVAAIAGDPQRNVDFYAGVLGMHLVKITVDTDDPTVYQLTYGDGLGQPGSLLSFTCWPGAVHGQPGPGQVVRTALAVPAASIDAWRGHLRAHGVAVETGAMGTAETCMFSDPDGLALELVADPDVIIRAGETSGPIPIGRAIQRLYGMTIWVREPAPTADFLTTVLGARPAHEAALPESHTYLLGRTATAARVTVQVVHGAASGLIAAGSVRSIGLRVRDEPALAGWRDRFAEHTGVVGQMHDRVYYRSTSLREPSGIHVDVATDGPGVGVDEAASALGMRVTLPPALETRRAQIIRALPPLHRPQARGIQRLPPSGLPP